MLKTDLLIYIFVKTIMHFFIFFFKLKRTTFVKNKVFTGGGNILVIIIHMLKISPTHDKHTVTHGLYSGLLL